MPASIATPGFLIAISAPSMAIVPEVAGVTPNSVSATLLRPEPTRPAKPSISPLRRSNEMSRNRPSSVRLRTESTTSPIGTVSFGNIWVISRPTISRMMSSRVTSAAACSPMKRPSRNTDTSSAISNSSFILWVM
jgi:hypothetical protein